MKVHIRMTQYDLLEKSTTIILETKALLNDSRLIYMENDGQHKHEITFADEEIVLKRSGKFGSETVLKRYGTGISTVHSPYGDMRLQTKLRYSEQTPEKWIAEYEILEGGNAVTCMRLVWDIAMPA